MLLSAGGHIPNMTQPLFTSTVGTQSRSAKVSGHKNCGQKNDGQTGSRCVDKAVLLQGGGGGMLLMPLLHPRP